MYASLEDDQGNLENKDADTVPVVEPSQPKLMSSTPAAPLTPGAPVFNPNSLVSENLPQVHSSIAGGPSGMVTVSNIASQPGPHEKSFEEVMAMQHQQTCFSESRLYYKSERRLKGLLILCQIQTDVQQQTQEPK